MITKNGRTYMISMVVLLLVITIATAYVGIQQIGHNSPANELSKETQKKQFVCSMHPEVIKDEPGDCPICGMLLIEKINQSAVTSKQFVCSMHPEVIKDEPGDCPICGMSLIEKIAHDSNSADSLLADVVRPVNASVLGSVATVHPFEENLPLIIETFGLINYDTRNIHTVSARFPGLIERSFIKYQFQPIRKGQKIYEIYCPDIYKDGWKYVRLIQTYPDQDDLTREALEWFKLLGLTAGQIDSLKRTTKPDFHLVVYSDADGYAVSADFDPETYFSSGTAGENELETSQGARPGIGFNEGLTIETGRPLFKIINLNSLRADLKVRTEEVGLLRKGQKVIFTDAGNHHQRFDATINQIEPLNGGVFQSVKVYFKNQESWMKPGRQIQGQILLGDHQSLWLPRSSVINMGKQQSVFVMHNGRFKATAIKTGMRCGDKIEVIGGIDKNSEVASNALLLTDSDCFIQLDEL